MKKPVLFPVLLLAFLLTVSLACALALPAAVGAQTAQAPEKTYAGWAVGDSTDGYGMDRGVLLK